jgi:hypothetical protein
VEGDKIQNTTFTANVEVTKKSLSNIPRNNGGAMKANLAGSPGARYRCRSDRTP